jgi:putative transposase
MAGEFMLAHRRHCYPLTISEFASLHLISCEVPENTRAMYAFSLFERAFRDWVEDFPFGDPSDFPSWGPP